jgi:hypothetical protein
MFGNSTGGRRRAGCRRRRLDKSKRLDLLLHITGEVHLVLRVRQDIHKVPWPVVHFGIGVVLVKRF